MLAVSRVVMVMLKVVPQLEAWQTRGKLNTAIKGEQTAKQILIQKDPKSNDNTLGNLTEKELVAKANTTLELMDTESLEMPPGVAFIGAKKMRNGNILYKLIAMTQVPGSNEKTYRKHSWKTTEVQAKCKTNYTTWLRNSYPSPS